MLSFSDYTMKKQISEMVFKYNLDLTGIAEAVAHQKNHQFTEEVLNEFLGRAVRAVGGALKGAFTGGRDSWKDSGSGRRLAEKSVQDFYNSILRMGVSEPKAKKMMDQLYDYLDEQEKEIAMRYQFASADQQKRPASSAAQQKMPYAGYDDQGPKMRLTPVTSPAPADAQINVPTPRLPAGDEFTIRRP